MKIQPILLLLILGLAACGPSKNEKALEQPKIRPTESDGQWNPVTGDPRAPMPPVIPQTVIDPKDWKTTVLEIIPFGSAHSSPDEIAAFRKEVAELSSNDASRSMSKMMASRTPEGMREMMRMLTEYEQKIPDTLPSQVELDALAMAVNKGTMTLPPNHWKVSFRKAVELAAALVMYGVPEAAASAESFRRNLHMKWAQIPQAQLYLKSLDMEIKHAYADVAAGIMPWQERKFTKIK
ncbi:MAG: hypothetical protein NTY98_05410 [Verrucomicrobia bacterium]|nr:hypothetical protein [Verrucomicrobiota bacterium]